MSKSKSLNIDNVLRVLKEVKGKQIDAAKKLQTSQASVSRCLKQNGYVVGEIIYVQQERAS